MLGFYHISYKRLRLELKHPNKKKIIWANMANTDNCFKVDIFPL